MPCGLGVRWSRSRPRLRWMVRSPLPKITRAGSRANAHEMRHNSDAILTGIGTVLADDCLLTDRTGQERSRPLLRIVADSTLRIPLDSRMVASSCGDVA